MLPGISLDLVLLAFFRLTPLLLVTPITPFSRLPLLVRVAVTLLMALLMAGINPPGAFRLQAATLATEFAFGMAMAFGFHAAIAGLQAAGKLLDQQIGFSAAAVLNPATQLTDALVGEILVIAFVLVFLSVDGLQQVLAGFAALQQVVPLGAAFIPAPQSIVATLGKMLVMGFMLASPVIVLMWLTDFMLAVASRSMPQANVYFLAIPIKLAIGMLALSALLMQARAVLIPILNATFDNWSLLLEHGNP